MSNCTATGFYRYPGIGDNDDLIYEVSYVSVSVSDSCLQNVATILVKCKKNILTEDFFED